MNNQSYLGIFAIGDPHIESRVPGFRKDDYPKVILEKLRWCLQYAADQRLLPLILGDLFQLPRDNPNWVLGQLGELFHTPVLAISGNHDCRENTVSENDSISVLARAGRLIMLTNDALWRGTMSGRRVVVGGTPWGQYLPQEYVRSVEESGALVFWLAHHDVMVPGYEEQGHIRPREMPGIDVVLNGHIHRCLPDLVTGSTTWVTPGNISRRARGDAARHHVPAAVRIDVEGYGWRARMVEIPHQPFEAVFHEAIQLAPDLIHGSAFVDGLAELQARRTQTGAGLLAFLERNLRAFDEDVKEEILRLSEEVTGNA